MWKSSMKSRGYVSLSAAAEVETNHPNDFFSIFILFFRFSFLLYFFDVCLSSEKREQMSSFIFHFGFISLPFCHVPSPKSPKMSGTRQIGTEMTENGKMKLDIFSHFSNFTRTLKIFQKKRNTKKQ